MTDSSILVRAVPVALVTGGLLPAVKQVKQVNQGNPENPENSSPSEAEAASQAQSTGG